MIELFRGLNGYVHCVVRRATGDEIADATQNGVILHSAALNGVVDEMPFDIGVTPSIVVGHDRWTGPQAERWRGRFSSSRLALIAHVHPEQIDGLKTEESIAQRASRTAEGTQRIGRADVAFAVGWQLADWWRAQALGIEILPFVPGLPTTLPDCSPVPPPHPRVLLLGRAEDAELKGIYVAARAMSQVVGLEFRDA